MNMNIKHSHRTARPGQRNEYAAAVAFALLSVLALLPVIFA